MCCGISAIHMLGYEANVVIGLWRVGQTTDRVYLDVF
jgi:hypothetical protein